MSLKLQTYKKKFTHSYSFGPHATFELMAHRPENIKQIIIHSRSEKNAGVEKIKDFCSKKNIKIEINDGLLRNLSGKDNMYIAGIFTKFPSPISAQENHVALVEPSGTGNLGTIIRTMVGYGVKNLAIIRHGVDIFDPKVIRASMGALFKIQFEYFDSIEHYQERFENNLYSFMTDGKHTLQDIVFEKPYTLIFGNESSGLPNSYKKISKTIRIQQSSDIDSLNLAVSVGIGLYESFLKK